METIASAGLDWTDEISVQAHCVYGVRNVVIRRQARRSEILKFSSG